jgi:hypothetical protein
VGFDFGFRSARSSGPKPESRPRLVCVRLLLLLSSAVKLASQGQTDTTAAVDAASVILDAAAARDCSPEKQLAEDTAIKQSRANRGTMTNSTMANSTMGGAIGSGSPACMMLELVHLNCDKSGQVRGAALGDAERVGAGAVHGGPQFAICVVKTSAMWTFFSLL